MINYSSAARLDIIAIYRYGATQFGPSQALSYTSALNEMIGLLAHQPKLATLRHEFQTPVRIHPWRQHYIIYHTDDTDLMIVRILHRASDVTQHLMGDTD